MGKCMQNKAAILQRLFIAFWPFQAPILAPESTKKGQKRDDEKEKEKEETSEKEEEVKKEREREKSEKD